MIFKISYAILLMTRKFKIVFAPHLSGITMECVNPFLFLNLFCFSFLLANTRAFIFYAVPHRGSDIASMAAGKARYFLLPSVDVKVLQKGE